MGWASKLKSKVRPRCVECSGERDLHRWAECSDSGWVCTLCATLKGYIDYLPELRERLYGQSDATRHTEAV